MKPFELFLAWRYLRGQRRINGKGIKLKPLAKKPGGMFLSFVSYVAIGGIAMGVWALIVVVSVMNGFQRDVRENVLSVVSHAVVHRHPGITYSLEDWHNLAQELQRNNAVVASAPFIEKQGLVSDQGVVRPVVVRGVDPAAETGVSDFLSSPLSGTVDFLQPQSYRAMIGIYLANNLNVSLGDSFTLIAPHGNFSPVGIMPRMRRFEVSGIFNSELYEYDAGLILININDASTLFQVKEGADALRLRFNDVLQARQRVFSLNQYLPTGLYATDWSASHANFFRAVEIEKRMMFLILSIIIAVASFNVLNQQMMLINEKTSDIAILRTLGVSSQSIVRLFLLQGFFLGSMGIFIGVVVGIITAWNVEEIVSTMEAVLQVKFLSPEVYPIPSIPSQLLWGDVIITTVVAFSIILIATIYPSFRASRILPAEALRHE